MAGWTKTATSSAAQASKNGNNIGSSKSRLPGKRADLDGAEAQPLTHPPELLDGERGVLHGQRRHANEPVGIGRAQRGDVLVLHPRPRPRGLRLRPVAEHRGGGEMAWTSTLLRSMSSRRAATLKAPVSSARTALPPTT